jgi:hypothetical protein
VTYVDITGTSSPTSAHTPENGGAGSAAGEPPGSDRYLTRGYLTTRNNWAEYRFDVPCGSTGEARFADINRPARASFDLAIEGRSS